MSVSAAIVALLIIVVIELAILSSKIGKAITTFSVLLADIQQSVGDAGEQLDSIRLAARAIEKVAERFGK